MPAVKSTKTRISILILADAGGGAMVGFALNSG
jgi:hypothetical protein